MYLLEEIASVYIDGKYYPLKKGITTVGALKIDLAFENKADNFYSWVVNIENDSDESSPRITRLSGLDTTLSVSGNVNFNSIRGDDCTIYSFYPVNNQLADGDTITRSPANARSSNTTAFPYFDLEDENGDGIVCGIGWSGQWKLDIERKGDDIRLVAGFQDCDFYLEPHEKVRSVRILLYIGSGGEEKLRHQFVRLHRKYYSPIPEFNSDTYFPVSASCFDRYYWGNIPKDGEINYFETEEAQLNIIENAVPCKQFNTFWLDACWFEGAFRTGVGNYRCGEGFPNGLKKLSKSAHNNGMKFVLWFEPVRASVGTDVYNEFHSKEGKILSIPDSDRYLVHLGDSEIWQYQFEQIAKTIEENDVDVYRQDFNIDPYPYLRRIETDDRVGIEQIHFVEGMYKLWDALLERFPNILLDNCASGGRLLDVETNMRSIPLWRSDVSCRPSPLGIQNELLGLSKYIPYHQGGTFDYTPYFLRSSMTTGVGCEFGFLHNVIEAEKEKTSMKFVSADIFKVSEVKNFGISDPSAVETALNDALRLREYWGGDFTALTLPSDSKDAIIAYTLRIEEEDRGVVLVFRREEAPETFTVKISDVSPNKEYILKISDEDLVETEKIVTGKQLLDGFAVNIEKAPGSLLVFYKAQ